MLRLIRFCLLAAPVLAAAPAAAQTLHIALREDPDIMDPSLARTYVGREVFAGLCDKLFDIDASLKIVPQLATGYEQPDPTTLVIHLRQGVKFHDGEAMDAASVKYSLERHLTIAGSFRRSEIGLLDHVDIVDPLTVKLTLKSPSAPFLSQLTDRAGIVVSPKAAEAMGKDFGAHPVCAGPFKWVERVPQDHITLAKFDGYWDVAAIHVDRVVYQIIYDSTVRLANLRSGAVDLVEYIVPTDFDAVRADPKLKLVVSDALGYYGLTTNTYNGKRADTPFGRDPRVRQAFSLSIDRDALMQVVYNGVFPPTGQPEPPASPFHFDDVKPPARDIKRAHALLAEAGVKEPVSLELVVATSPDLRQLGEVIQAMAAEGGFAVKVLPTEYASSLAAAHDGNFEIYATAWSGRTDIDGDTYSFLHTGGAQNDGHFSDPAMDKALDDARVAPTLDARRALYRQAIARENELLPIIYLYSRKNTVGHAAKLTGFTPVPDGLIRIQGIRIGR